ncbi:uncharacterized protein LOC131324005 [Rhododendron vialii]|uniref:uncharacterized protein LOC131324005 n=1 Tax=Rhododendron vialii TaxID=182163 RepID=UPI00265E0656|nr:uncharacterized protein LOC131324005 [Rhododendron vialii]
MDKSWMKLGSTAHGRTSQLYFDGVNSFLEYAAAVGDRQGNILCPCRKCVNCRRQNLQEVHLHLFQYGIVQSYTTWHEHGEPRVSDTVHPCETGNYEVGNLDGIDALVEDRIRADSMDTTQREEVRNFDKFHDCHVLIQRILPIGMCGFVDKEISIALFELGTFFQDLCSRTVTRSKLEQLEERAIHILCKLEKIFPPAFFDVMVHLIIHLPREAILEGPVHYRWMYPIERFLGTLKNFVSNRAQPEGSIVEAYIVKECLTFCAMYLDGIETVHNQHERNEDLGDRRKGLTVFTETARPIGQVTRDGEMSQELRHKAHWFLLYNSPEVEKYLEEHKNQLQVSSGHDITRTQQEEFPKWFKERVRYFPISLCAKYYQAVL